PLRPRVGAETTQHRGGNIQSSGGGLHLYIWFEPQFLKACTKGGGPHPEQLRGAASSINSAVAVCQRGDNIVARAAPAPDACGHSFLYFIRTKQPRSRGVTPLRDSA